MMSQISKEDLSGPFGLVNAPKLIKSIHRPNPSLAHLGNEKISNSEYFQIINKMISDVWSVFEDYSPADLQAMLTEVRVWLKMKGDRSHHLEKHLNFLESLRSKCVSAIQILHPTFQEKSKAVDEQALQLNSRLFDALGSEPGEGWATSGGKLGERPTLAQAFYHPPVGEEDLGIAKRYPILTKIRATKTWGEVFELIEGEKKSCKHQLEKVTHLVDLMKLRESIMENVLYQHAMLGKVTNWDKIDELERRRSIETTEQELERSNKRIEFIKIMSDSESRREYINEKIIGNHPDWSWQKRYEELYRACEENEFGCPFADADSLKTVMNKWKREQRSRS